ncbi:MAG: hypothetical protein JNM22_06685 [Saprospiraceae bacterium]|nr:hypothetical protein [Saprospiraceae bacterium]
MTSEQTSATLRQLIADNQNKAAAELLYGWFEGKSASRQDAALALLNRIKALDSQVLGGLIAQADADLERNRITKALLELGKQLDETGEADMPEPAPESKAWIYGVIVILLAGMVYLAFDKRGSSTAPPETFNLQVHVHGPGGEADLITAGKIKLLLGTYHSPIQDVNSNGQAVFTEIPGKYLAEPVQLVPMDRYKVTAQSARSAQESRNLTFTLTPIPDTTLIRGMVYLPGPGNRPAAGATLDFNGGQATALTDEKGRFQMAVPLAAGKTAPLMIEYQGKNRYHRDLTVSTGTLFQLTLNP